MRRNERKERKLAGRMIDGRRIKDRLLMGLSLDVIRDVKTHQFTVGSHDTPIIPLDEFGSRSGRSERY
jgi:hypothetical protein